MALDLAEVMRKARAGQPLSFLRLARIYSQNGWHQKVVDLARDYLNDSRLAGMAYACYAEALLLQTGDLDRSVGLFHQAARLPGIGIRCEAAKMIISPNVFVHFADLYSDHNSITYLNSPAARPRFVMCASGDEKYYTLFGEIFRDRFLAFNPESDLVLHFHLFDPSESLLGEVESWIARTRQQRVFFSIEFTGGKNRTYYYAGRFVQMPRLLMHYGCPIAVSDIDTVFTAGMEGLIHTAGSADLGLLELADRYLPWERFMATLAVFAPTPNGVLLTRALSAFLVQAPSSSINYWWIDQLGLAECAYASSNLNLGTVAPIRAARRRMCFQRTRNTRRPDDKAIAVRDFVRRHDEQKSRRVP